MLACGLFWQGYQMIEPYSRILPMGDQGMLFLRQTTIEWGWLSISKYRLRSNLSLQIPHL